MNNNYASYISIMYEASINQSIHIKQYAAYQSSRASTKNKNFCQENLTPINDDIVARGSGRRSPAVDEKASAGVGR